MCQKMSDKINSDSEPLQTRLLLLGAATGMVAGLFILGSLPIAVGLFRPPIDKFVHAGFFSILTIFLCHGTNRSNLPAVFSGVALIGILDEWHQYYLPGRTADILDLTADITAAGTIIFIIYLIRRYKTE
jgi:hypothetical protein